MSADTLRGRGELQPQLPGLFQDVIKVFGLGPKG